MPLQIIKKLQDKKNQLLGRRELRILIQQDAATPSKADLTKMIAELESVETEKVDVAHIYQRYGKLVTEAVVNIYDKPPVKKEKKEKKEKAPEEKAAAPAKA